jgi:hypothetical protein
VPYVKLTILQTGLSHSWWVIRTMSASAFAVASGADSPHCGFMYGVSFATSGTRLRSLKREKRGITGWSVTAFATIVRTSGTRPATADIMKLVDPWQWMTALSSSAPVSSATLRTAYGWSCSAAWSSVHSFGGRSMLARQFSSQTS